jgi:hypothetical protein
VIAGQESTNTDLMLTSHHHRLHILKLLNIEQLDINYPRNKG